MDEYIDRFGPERVWLATVVVLVAAVAAAAALFPQRVYVDLIWQYYWGPVVADANGWSCVAWAGGEQVSCARAGANPGPTASPGYTFQSYAGYIPTLILLLLGFVFAVKRLDIERYRAGFYGLFPFMLFGGALRVVEDANVAMLRETGDAAISLPWSALIISPFIYVTVAVVTLLAVVVSVWLDRAGRVSGFEYPLAGIGTILLALTVALLVSLTTDVGYGFYPAFTAYTIVGATATAFGTYWLIERVAPALNRGTRLMGAVVVFAHTVDGIANLLGLSYATDLGWPHNMGGKHPVNVAIVDFFGNAWPFLALKIVAAVFVVWLFNEEVFEESPRFSYLLMITVVAVGLGPGTRDMLRATFGV